MGFLNALVVLCILCIVDSFEDDTDLEKRISMLERFVARKFMNIELEIEDLRVSVIKSEPSGTQIDVVTSQSELVELRNKFEEEIRELRSTVEILSNEITFADTKTESTAQALQILKMAFLEEKVSRVKLQSELDVLSEKVNRQKSDIRQIQQEVDHLQQNASDLTEGINELTTQIDDHFIGHQDTFTDDVNELAVNLTKTREVVCSLNSACTEWSLWGDCSGPCGNKKERRTRTCTEENALLDFCQFDVDTVSEERSCRASGGCCPEHYKTVAGQYCFKVSKKTKINNEIKLECEAEGGHLVTLTSEEKQEAFVNFARQEFGSSWLVLIDGRNIDGSWIDHNGLPLTYTNWMSGKGSGDCIYLQLRDKLWSSTSCTGSIYSYFCEM